MDGRGLTWAPNKAHHREAVLWIGVKQILLVILWMGLRKLGKQPVVVGNKLAEVLTPLR